VWNGKLIWGHLTDSRALSVLKNPAYAGVYVFGRFRCVKEILQDGQIRQRVRETPRDSWLVEIQNHHEGYVTWDEHLANQDQLQRNRTNRPETMLPQAAREGLALLQGLLVCGKCGRRLTVRYRGNGGIYPIYECNWLKRQGQAMKSCMTFPCPPLDKPMAERILQALNSNQLQLALTAQDELAGRDGSVRRQWQMRLQRAQYEADLAQRRYEQVDPENRLVAASLEQRWNAALARVDEVRRQMDEFGRRQTRTFTQEQRQRILALAGDFPLMWKSSTTSWKDRKRMLRLLLEDIAVERDAGRQVRLHVRWSGGACEDLSVELPAKMPDRIRYPSQRVEQVRELAKQHGDEEIAEILNCSGQRSSHGKSFTAAMISWIRYKHRIPTPELKRPEELTACEVAEKFGVSRGVVYYWINRDILPARQQKPGRSYWITLSREKEDELSRWVRESKRIPKTHTHQAGHDTKIPNAI
jgi:hypothetical protein